MTISREAPATELTAAALVGTISPFDWLPLDNNCTRPTGTVDIFAGASGAEVCGFGIDSTLRTATEI